MGVGVLDGLLELLEFESLGNFGAKDLAASVDVFHDLRSEFFLLHWVQAHHIGAEPET